MTLNELSDILLKHMEDNPDHANLDLIFEYVGGCYTKVGSVRIYTGKLEDWGDGTGGFNDYEEKTDAIIDFWSER